MGIPIFGKFESKTTDGILVDANAVGGLKKEITSIVAGGTVDSEWVEGSTSPVQSQLIQAEIAKLREEISGISISVDSALSPASENPVQNKVVNEALENIRNEIDSIREANGARFGKTDFMYKFSNAEKTLVSSSNGNNSGTLQWYSYDGEIVEVDLQKIDYKILGSGYEILGGGGVIVDRLRLEDSADNVIKEQHLPTTSGSLTVGHVISFTKNTTIVFELKGFVSPLSGVEQESFSTFNSLVISFPVYYGAAGVENAPEQILSTATKERVSTIKGKTRTILIEEEPQYIWFLTTEEIGSITNNGFNAGFYLWGTINIGDGEYNCYRTAAKIVPGTYTFDIK